MENSTITKTSIPGLVLIKRPTNEDDRGFFREPARIREIEEVTGIKFNVAQMNHSRSSKNTLRGIHVAPWNKLIYVTRGRVQIVNVDLREGSETYKKVESFVIRL
jgi:dTDP-4-dehydrorhamnose 3,5-epimerase